MNHQQEAPFAIQIELSKGCNLQCTFCGINGFQERPGSTFQFMSIETADKLAKQIKDSNWTSRLEFAMHGEPTMNPKWIEIIKVFRSYLDNQIMVTTNGGGIVKTKQITSTILSFFKAGGNKLAIDEYEKINFVSKIRNELDVLDLDDIGVNVYEYPKESKGNPHRRGNENFVCFIAPISLSKNGTHSSLGNHCGSGGELNFSVKQRCAKPFRELSICWDGSINLCCNDFLGEFTAGNINSKNIVEIWNGPEFSSARKFLMVPDRDSLRPCRGCSHKSYRNGLLPDKKGKTTLSAPTKEDHEIVMSALSDGPDRSPTARAERNILPHLTEEESSNWI